MYKPSMISDLMYDRRCTGSVAAYEHQLATSFMTSDGVHKDQQRAVVTGQEVHDFSQSVFSRLYENPEKSEGDAQGTWQEMAHDALSESAKFAELQTLLKGDADLSALAVPAFRSVFEEARRMVKAKKDQDEKQDGNEGNQRRPRTRGIRQVGTDERALKRKAQAAAERAKADVNDMKQQLNGLMAGAGDTPPATTDEGTERFQIAQRLQGNGNMKEISKIVGRLRRVQQRKARRKSKNGATALHSVTQGKNVTRLLPSELARLAHGSTKDLAMLDLMEGKMLEYRLRGEEPEGRGNMVILLDISGSMCGAPHNIARAIGIFFAGVAKEEKRSIQVFDFNGIVQVQTASRIDKDGKGTIGLSDAPRTPLAVAAHIASVSVSGGTSFERALQHVIDHCDLSNKPDVVFVTDGHDAVSDRTRDRIHEFKQANDLKVWGMLINGGKLHGNVDFCDSVHTIPANPSLDDIVVMSESATGRA